MQPPDLLRYEKKAWGSGFLCPAGVDEAGRGPLAGPVVAAAVILPPEHAKTLSITALKGLTDSKQLREKDRDHFFTVINEHAAIGIGIGIVEATEIDQLNILKATHLAMAKALEQIAVDYALVDGLPVSGLPCPSESIVKGDQLSLSISAASVIAKVTRDGLMKEYDTQYPAYGFAQHKGYGTPAHLAALEQEGPSPIHRRSFRPVAALDQLDLW
jgi:ribonuclease HII